MMRQNQSISLVLGILATLIAGAIAAPAALAVVEAPYWKVNGGRLGAGVPESTIVRNVSKTKPTISGELKEGKSEKSTPVEVRCEKLKSGVKAAIIGSKPEHDSLAALTIKLDGCSLWLKVGEKSVEEKLCAVEPIESEGELEGKLWYEGTKTGGGHEIAVLFEKAKTAAIIGKVTLKGSLCPWAGGHAIEGNFAGKISPVDSESLVTKIVMSSPGISEVWQPQESGLELSPKLTVDGRTATLIDELEVELAKPTKFGAFNM